MGQYVFPRWSNTLLPSLIATAIVVPLYATLVVAYGFSPRTTNVGYQPVQPVAFSHLLHAGDLGMDCRYCHTTVERADEAAIPPTQTCMGCHVSIQRESPLLEPVRYSFETGMPVPWVRVHDLPDYAYFSHQAHVARGVSCVECHGRIDRMDRVYQHEMLSMGWCLSCHRDPEPSLRDPSLVTKLSWGWDRTDEERREGGAHWRELNRLNPSQDCSTCHR
jgi:hypothetical protein